MKIFMTLLILALTLTTSLAAEIKTYCQQDTNCTACVTGQSCSVTGIRIDSGSSRGKVATPPSNSERQLEQNTFELSPYSALKKEPSKPVIVKKTELKQIFDSSRAARFVSGKSALTVDLKQDLTKLAEQLQDKNNLTITVSGHTDPQRMSAKTAAIYVDNYGLGKARAEETADFLASLLGLNSEAIKTVSYGPDRSIADNNSSAGMARNRRVEIAVSYDREVVHEEIVKSVKEVAPSPLRSCSDVLDSRMATANQPFRISVDGVPLQDNGSIDPDIQRCTDLGLEQADLQIRYDDLELTPALNISASPNSAVRDQHLSFNVYSNYDHWISKREVRIFLATASLQGQPLLVIPISENNRVSWTPTTEMPNKIKYLLRVYDNKGRFDETTAKELRIDHKAKPQDNIQTQIREELIGYGENSLRLRNIPVKGGTISANGRKLPQGSQVLLMGQSIPVDANGKFAARQILPAGPHQVNLKIVNTTGELDFTRNLYIPDRDWFYVAIADLFAGQNSTSGPAQLVTQDTQHYDNDIYIDGRLAFYLKGKVKGEWLLTAAADTQEQPLDELFSNFDSKDPRYLLRRLDPDLYYPVYGDDSTTVEDAPTRGKFYVKLKRGDSHVMWGNFQTRWTGTDFANFNRGMYGAGVRWASEQQTSFGEKQTEVDLLAGDPGTLDGRDEFRGTGGSLYYLRHLDITLGSEKVWAEVRDKDSGLVLETKQLSSGQDYEINSLQGRILLTQPLASLADDSQLVKTSSLSGHPQYLVTTYEYVPSVSEIDNMTLGGRASSWLNDHIKVGITGYRQGDDAAEQKIGEADFTLRYAAGTYLRGEIARSDGSGSGSNTSGTGGFEFSTTSAVDTKAIAQRIEVALDLAEVSDQDGKVSAYWQEREKGFSGPGQIAAEEISQFGASFTSSLNDKLNLSSKFDVRDAETRDTGAIQVTAHYLINQKWAVAVGGRFDDIDDSNVSADKNGERTDLSGQVEYKADSDSDNPDWSMFGFVQGTVQRSNGRDENNRIGVGGLYKISDPFTLSAEISDGNGGLGGKAGADWRVNERSQLYMNYAVDTDRTDDRYRGRQGSFTTGGKTRYSDSLSVYAEERLQHGSGPSGLIHAFGLDLAALDRWNFGLKFETGELSEPDNEDLDRTAVSFSAGYAKEKTRYAGNLEWRKDDGTTSGKRTTWLMRNSLGYQASPDWRLLTKLNLSVSDSDKGDFYNADFIEAVVGYAYRPVMNDKLNALFKYTFFYDLPSAGALTASETVADYAQRSHVLSADAIYDLKPWLSIGGKYGFRKGEMRENRVGGSWHSSDAHLAVLRSDWHFVHKWDALLEARWLRVTAANDERAGFLAAIYRHFGRNFKLGAGYNFTDFSDDLTDLDYDSKGWFVNLVGKL
jgi:outer membrane protein OmpA-like peptidoglycan-associated protein